MVQRIIYIFLEIFILSTVFLLSKPAVRGSLQLNIILAAYIVDNRYLNQHDSDFVDLVISDLTHFLPQVTVNRVLIFPPVENRYRFLIHKTVEDFPQLGSFSVGEGSERQTVICLKDSLKRGPRGQELLMYGHQEQPAKGRGRGQMRDVHSSPANRSGTDRPGTMQDMTQPEQKQQAEHKQHRSSRFTGKGRARPKRPEQQLYVPRALRNKENDSQSPVLPSKGTEKRKKDQRTKETPTETAEHGEKNQRVVDTGDSVVMENRETAHITTAVETVSSEDITAENTSSGELTQQVKEERDMVESVSSDATSTTEKENRDMLESVCSENSESLSEDSSKHTMSAEVTECLSETELSSEAVEMLQDRVTNQSEETCAIGTHSETDTSLIGSETDTSHFVEAVCTEVTNQSEAKTATETTCTEVTEEFIEERMDVETSTHDSKSVCPEVLSPELADDKGSASSEGQKVCDGDSSSVSCESREEETVPECAGDASHMEVSPEKPAEASGTSQGSEEDDDDDSWDKIFDDNGDCLDSSKMEELSTFVGKVKISKPKKVINYLEYTPKEPDMDLSAFSHVIEISDFPATFKTPDLLTAFKQYMNSGFDIKWVDDTHALGIFSSTLAANQALQTEHPMLKIKPLSEASKESRLKAKRSQEFLQPFKPRPQTSAVAARRLVTGALGLTPRVPKEKREKESKILKEAREKKNKDKKTRKDIWDWETGKCAMDN